MTFTTFVSGIDTNFSSQLNSNFNTMKILSLNTASSSTTSSSYALLASHTISSTVAAKIGTAIVIEVLSSGGGSVKYNGSAFVYSTSGIEIKIGTTGSETQKFACNFFDGVSNNVSGSHETGGSLTRSIKFYYVPTVGEISTGFNILINGISTNGGMTTFTVTHIQSIITGVMI